MNLRAYQTQEPNEQADPEKWMRIATGLELLEAMARDEEDPVRQELLYALWAEAKCVS